MSKPIQPMEEFSSCGTEENIDEVAFFQKKSQIETCVQDSLLELDPSEKGEGAQPFDPCPELTNMVDGEASR